MAFTVADVTRVIRHLGVNRPQAEAGLATVTEADWITEVQSVLDQLDTLRASILAERSSANNALIQADVLHWAEGGRTAGMETERTELQWQLAQLLSIELGWSRPNNSGSVDYNPYG